MHLSIAIYILVRNLTFHVVLALFSLFLQNEHDKIRELTQQLALERKRATTYKRQLELLFQQIDEHNESLSKKVKHIVDSVQQMENNDQQGCI